MLLFLSLKIDFVLANSADSDEMPQFGSFQRMKDISATENAKVDVSAKTINCWWGGGGGCGGGGCVMHLVYIFSIVL